MNRLPNGFAGNIRPLCLIAGLSLLLSVLDTGCSTFVARRMAQAPNSYPGWLAPSAPVLISFDKSLLANSPELFADVGPPPARLSYRVVEPAEFHLKVISTKSAEQGDVRYRFEFRGEMPRANAWTAAPRGTVVLLHGYGLAEFAMAPWAFQLAQEGWRCVLVDLRGHGKSTGKMIYFGIIEARDMSQLLDALKDRNQLAPPVTAIGDSYGAALALRWKTMDSRVGRVVAIAPYGVLSDATLNICRDYAKFLPQSLLRAGLKQLPAVLHVNAGDLDTTTVLARHPVAALFVGGAGDNVVPVADLRRLCSEALPGSELIVVPGATHETLPYHFSELVPPVLGWLSANE